MDLQSLAVDTLVDRLRAGGLSASRASADVYTGVGELSARFTSVSGSDQGRALMTQLGLELALDGERRQVIYESLVGTGQTPSEAVGAALDNWAELVWPPVRSLFTEAGVPGVRRLQLCAGADPAGLPREWAVCVGSPQAAGEQRAVLLERLEAQAPYALILPSLVPYLRDDRLHWVRLVGVRQRDLSVETEVRLDNNAAPDAAAALAYFSWPATSGYLLFRQFLILKPVARPAASGPTRVGADRSPEPDGRKWWRFWD